MVVLRPHDSARPRAAYPTGDALQLAHSRQGLRRDKLTLTLKGIGCRLSTAVLAVECGELKHVRGAVSRRCAVAGDDRDAAVEKDEPFGMLDLHRHVRLRPDVDVLYALDIGFEVRDDVYERLVT